MPTLEEMKNELERFNVFDEDQRYHNADAILTLSNRLYAYAAELEAAQAGGGIYGESDVERAAEALHEILNREKYKPHLWEWGQLKNGTFWPQKQEYNKYLRYAKATIEALSLTGTGKG